MPWLFRPSLVWGCDHEPACVSAGAARAAVRSPPVVRGHALSGQAGPAESSGTGSLASSRWLLGVKLALGLGVLVVSFFVFSGAAARGRFDPDENLYMWRGRYFGHIFLHHDINGPEWGDSYWTHTQPMFTNYLVGGWLWLRGYDPYRMPAPWDWGKGKGE